MAIADDISVAANGDIRYTGAGPNYTVIAFHRFLQDLADDAVATGDDLLDITDVNPSDRSTDNIVTLLSTFNIDDALAEHLFDGSITQSSGATVYSGLVVLGTLVTGTNLQIVQDNGLLTNYWTTGINADAANNISLRIMIKTRVNGLDIDGKRIRVQARKLGDTYGEFSVTMGLGNSTAAVSTSTDLNNATVEGTIAGWTTITNTEGLRLLDVDANAANEEYYSEWNRDIFTINQLYERTKWLQRRGTASTLYGMNGELFRGITHQIIYDGELAGPFVQNEDIAWGTTFAYDTEVSGPFVVGEKLTFGTSGAVGTLLQLTDAGVTGSMVVAIEPGTGTVADNNTITGATSLATAAVNDLSVGGALAVGGTGRLLALDDAGVTGNLYIQLLTGLSPVDNLLMKGITSSATALVNGAPISRTISPEYLGVSTGSAIIGAYGIGIEPPDLTASDKLFDLTNTQITPPNNVTFTVSGLISGEDRVLVGPESAGSLVTAQLTGVIGQNANAATTVVVNEAIPTDTPATGTIRTFNGNTFERTPYTSFTGSTFTLTGTLTSDMASHTIIYDTRAVANFTVGETLTFLGGETAELLAVEQIGSAVIGTIHVRMLAGAVPVDNDTITGGTSGATALVNGAPTAVGCFISYIDELAGSTTATFTSVFLASRNLLIKVRDGGVTPIKPFETTGTLGSAGGSTTAIRTNDS